MHRCCVAVCCGVSGGVAVCRWRVVWHLLVAADARVLQSVAVCFSVLQCVAVCRWRVVYHSLLYRCCHPGFYVCMCVSVYLYLVDAETHCNTLQHLCVYLYLVEAQAAVSLSS